jgi:triphosphatase
MSDRMLAAEDTGTSGREVELKLHVAPADLPRLVRHPFLKAIREGEVRTRRLHTVYWDTADFDLLGHGVALRVRRDGSGRIMTLKAMAGDPTGDSAVVAVRREWEWVIPGDRPEPARLTGEEVRELVPADALAKIRPIFDTRFRRTKLVLRPAPLSLVELALDLGEIRAGGNRIPVSEIELELKAGRVGALYDLALALQRIVPLRIGTVSKAEAGYDLALGRPAAAHRAGRPAFTPLTTVAEAFRHIARSSIAEMLASSAGVRAGDAEAIGRMDAALRRLRSAIKLFGEVVTAPDTRDVVEELRWLARRIRAARNWDVLQGRLYAAFETTRAGDEAAAAFSEALGRARLDAHRLAAEAVDAPRYTTLVLWLGGWIEEGRWCRGADGVSPALLDNLLAAPAAAWLVRRHGKAEKAGRHIRRLDDRGLRRLGKRIARLHHAADLLRGIHPPALLGPYMEAVEAVRDVLSTLEDLTEARELATSLAGSADGPPQEAAERFAAWIDRQVRRQLDALSGAWTAFRKAQPVRM